VFHPLVFQWVKTVAFSTPAQFDPASFPQLSHALSIAESRFALEALRARLGLTGPVLEPGLDFYIPVLFVASIQTEPPSSGQSTLPNSSCGGVRIVDHPAPPDGLVVVSETRQPETLAHELGHYLGLCHTHDEIAAYGLAGLAAECEVTGDGICDTPWDPGPEQCALLERCGTRCPESGAQPDAANVMSYYMPCRRGLSAEQMAVVEHGLQLRRGWFRCLNPDDCPCLPGEAGACPIAMSCRPEADDGSSQCALDGPALPGAPCGDLADCSGGSMCIGAGVGAAHKSRCVRACRVAAADCACADLGLPFRLCSEDLE
jgi:hypothetical protein